MKVLLFDMDGVLLQPRGYHEALRTTVSLIGRSLGYRAANLSQKEIDIFESVGVTNEWDSAAICSALMLRNVWTIDPDVRLPDAPPLPQLPSHDLQIPDFVTFFRSEITTSDQATSPNLLAERSLLKDLSEPQASALRFLLRGAHQIRGSLTHQLFQELVLGSNQYENSYALRPHLQTQGYLATYDQPLLRSDSCKQLLAWVSESDHRAVVFTNRPSLPPPDAFDTPEAELGLETAGMDGLPCIGRGGMLWLAGRRGLGPDDFLKPSPLHALTALQMALGEPLEPAAYNAASLALDRQADSSWEALIDAQLCVFEDSVKGLHSLQAAQKILAEIGIPVKVSLLGVTSSGEKRMALERAGAVVFAEPEEAIAHCGVFAAQRASDASSR